MQVPNNTSLNVGVSNLAPGGISVTLSGKSVQNLPTLTGVTRSPQPFMLAEIRIALVKAQSIANLYKAAMEADSFLGKITIRPDTNKLNPYDYYNCSITGVESLRFDGTDPGFQIMIEGFYPTNANMFNQTPDA
jgi:hypothetical protein